MGSASSGPAVGVTANPRVVYNEKLSKKENKVKIGLYESTRILHQWSL